MSRGRAAAAALREKSDAALVEACLEEDQAAWRELVRRYNRLVFAIPAQYGLPAEDIQDVFQNVFTALIEQLPKLREQQSLAKWLITTTHRTAWRQMDRRDRAVPVAGVMPSPDAPPPEVASRWERQHEVRQAVRRLGGRCEQLITAIYLDPAAPTYDQIARKLGIPRGSIGPSRARCLAKLFSILRADRLERNDRGG